MHLRSERFTILDMLDVALGMMAATSVEEKGPATYVVSAVVEHLASLGTEEGDLSASTVNQQYEHWAMRFDTLGAKRRSSSVDRRYSSPSKGPVENMIKELCGLVRCFSLVHLREKSEAGDND